MQQSRMRRALSTLTLVIAILLLLLTLPGKTERARQLDFGDARSVNLEGLVEELENDPSIVAVDMYGARLSNEQIEDLLTRFSNVEFGLTITIARQHTVRTSDTVFSLSHSNKSPRHKSKDFAMLKWCKDLRVVDLAHNDIDDIGFLGELPELRVALLGDNHISDLTPLAGLEHLEYIELFKNRLTDLSPLAQLPLLDLNIAFNKVVDYSPLYDIDSLERLWIYSSHKANQCPPQFEVDALHQHLPNTLINSDCYSTLGGWREHPRWYVIRNMTRRAYEWMPWGSDGYTQDMVPVPGER